MKKDKDTAVSRKNKREHLWTALTVLLSGFIFLAAALQKKGFYLDELLSFGLANKDFYPAFGAGFEPAHAYTGEEIWEQFFSVNRFQYAEVFANQAKDVHPPLYYLILHTICSILASHPAKLWYAGLFLNVVIGMGITWVLIRIFRFFILRGPWKYLLSLACIVSAGFLNNVVFIRMYLLLTFLTVLTAYVCLKDLSEHRRSFFVKLYFLTAAGMLTHYFFVIWLFFACLYRFVVFLAGKNWKGAVMTLVTPCLGLLTAYLIFPAMYEQIFSGYRGTQAFENFESASAASGISAFFSVSNGLYAGGLFFILLVLAVVLGVIAARKGLLSRTLPAPFGFLLVPSLLTFLLVAKIAPMYDARYVSNVMPLLAASMELALTVPALELAGNGMGKRALPVLAAAAVLVPSIFSLRGGIPNLYSDETEKVQACAERHDLVCYVIRGKQTYEYLEDLPELRQFDTVVFYDGEPVSTGEFVYEGLRTSTDGLVLYINYSVDADTVLEKAKEVNADLGLTGVRELFASSYYTVWELYRE